MSVAEIQYAETMEKGKPKVGGLSDPRLGTIDRKIKCETCMAGMAECPGHFGHLDLAKPMFHIGFMKTLLSIMRCVCFNCSKILVHEDNIQLKQALKIRNPKNRLRRIYDACKSNEFCDDEPVKKRFGCGARQPIITVDGMKMVVEYNALLAKYSPSTYSPSSPRMTPGRQISPDYSSTSPTSPTYLLPGSSYTPISPIDGSGLELISQKYNAQKMPIYLISGSKIIDEILGRVPGKTHLSNTKCNSGSSSYYHPEARGYIESGCRTHAGHLVPKNKEDYVISRSLELGEGVESMHGIYQQILRREMQNSRANVSYVWRLIDDQCDKCKRIRSEIASMGGSCQEIPAYLVR